MSDRPGLDPGSSSKTTLRSAPTLETERLILRHYRKDDFRPHHAIVGDDAIMRFIGGKGISAEDCWRRLAASVGMWDLVGFGGWAVLRKADGKLIGTVSLFNAWRALEPEFGEDPEMGWIFAHDAQGQGLAGEACCAVLDWADENLADRPVWAIVAPDNGPSLRLAEKLGFQRLQDSFYNGEKTAVLRRLPATAAAASATAA